MSTTALLGLDDDRAVSGQDLVEIRLAHLQKTLEVAERSKTDPSVKPPVLKHHADASAKDDDEWSSVRINRIRLHFEPKELEEVFRKSNVHKAFVAPILTRRLLPLMFSLMTAWSFINAWAADPMDPKYSESLNSRNWGTAIATLLMTMSLYIPFVERLFATHYTQVTCAYLVLTWLFRSLIISSEGSLGLMVSMFFTFFTLRGMFFPSIVTCFTDLVMYNMFHVVIYNLNDSTALDAIEESLLMVNILQLGLIFLGGSVAYKYEKALRDKFLQQQTYKMKKKHTQSVLDNIFPEHINQIIQENADARENHMIAIDEKSLSILFCDVTSFKKMLHEYSPVLLVAILDAVFSTFDEICERYGCQKMETVGKTYMACAGIPGTRKDHALACAEMSKAMLELMDRAGVEVRIGVHSGAVIAGVVGMLRPQFSLFGDTVNTSARIQSTGEPGHVAISTSSFAMLGDVFQTTIKEVEAKGKGILRVYLLGDRLDSQQTKKEEYDLVPMKFQASHRAGGEGEDNESHLYAIINKFTLQFQDPPEPIGRGFDASLEKDYVDTRYKETRFIGFAGPCLVVIVTVALEGVLQYVNKIDESGVMLGLSLRLGICSVGLLMMLLSYLPIGSDIWMFRLQTVYFFGQCFLTLFVPLYLFSLSDKKDDVPAAKDVWLRSTITYILAFTLFNALGLRFRNLIQVYLLILILYFVIVLAGFLPTEATTMIGIFFYSSYAVIGLLMNLIINFARELYMRRGFVLTRVNEVESRKAENLLYQMLPKAIGKELRMGVRSNAKVFSDVTILYSDIKNFTKYSASSSPDRVVRLLSTLFSIFDLLTDKHTVYKIQTIGDAYVLVAGLPFCVAKGDKDLSPEDRAASAAFYCMTMGVDMLQAVAQVRTEEGTSIQMRLGIHTGTITAGVIGEKKLRYDMWSNDCIISNRLESYSIPQCILLSETTRKFLQKSPQGHTDPRFDFLQPHTEYTDDGVRMKTYLYGPVGADGKIETDQQKSKTENKGADLQELVQILNIKNSGFIIQDTSKSKEEAKVTRLVWAGKNKENNSVKFLDNKVINTKYTSWNFIPKNLHEQFKLLMNKYFLAVAILQCIPQITPVNPLTTWIPLIGVFSFTAIKEKLDDYRRAKADKKANTTKVRVCRGGELVTLDAQDIVVGDILYLTDNEAVPADVVLLKTSFEQGHCFLQTANLDGETNFKNRHCLPCTKHLSENEVKLFSGAIVCDVPSSSLYDFDSLLWTEIDDKQDFLQAPSSEAESLSGAQLLQQGSRLVNTEWVYAVCVYTGNETKFGMNKEIPPLKLTKLDILTNTMTWNIFRFQFVLVIICGAIGIGYHEKSSRYDPWSESSKSVYQPTAESVEDSVNSDAEAIDFDMFQLVIYWARYLLLNSTFIPVSLKVTLDACKLFYAMRVNSDLALYDPVTNTRAKANSTAIGEDLGQVKYVLSDKTGTLTQNIMSWEACCVKTTRYELSDVGSEGPGGLFRAVMDGSKDEIAFLRNCALNNNVFPVLVNEADRKYQFKAASPDEVALVEAAARAGVVLQSRTSETAEICVNGTVECYELLQELEFNSDRKRMSTVYRNVDTQELIVCVKGADDVMLDKLADSERVAVNGVSPLNFAMTQLEVYAQSGLRTLFFAQKSITEAEFKAWSQIFHEANTSLLNREVEVTRAFAKLESNLLIQGITAIEDKLQDEVPETLAALREAGINIWMLTGDKFATALEIAKSCGLTGRDVGSDTKPLFVIEGATEFGVGDCIQGHLAKIEQSGNRFEEIAVISQGSSLAIALRYHSAILTDLCLQAKAVICCRVTPRQKADLVGIVKNRGHLTLAIGDGGNDVSMIQRANMGIGIRGKEGLQAARASDYAVSDFKSLRLLMFKHGHLAYKRTSFMVLYCFYKSFCFCIMQNAYSFATQFSGASLFSSMNVAMTNAVLVFPVLTIVFEKDFPIPTLMTRPALYMIGSTDHLFSGQIFLKWCGQGFLQAAVLYVVTILCCTENVSSIGQIVLADENNMGNIAFCAYLWLVSLMLLLSFKSLSLWTLIVTLLTMVGFLGVMLVTGMMMAFNSVNSFGAAPLAFRQPVFHLSIIIATMAGLLPWLAARAWQFNFNPSQSDQLQVFVAGGKNSRVYPMQEKPGVTPEPMHKEID